MPRVRYQFSRWPPRSKFRTRSDRLADYFPGMDRESLLIELHAGRERLRHALAGLPDSTMLDRVDDEWTRKDVLAHLERWERRVIELFERLCRGETPVESPETDELNAPPSPVDCAKAAMSSDAMSGDAMKAGDAMAKPKK